MSTYSLSLRGNLGRKLTIQELDDNFLYVLENASGGSASIGSEFEQTNTTSGFKLINKTEIFDTTVGLTLSLVGSYFTNSTTSWINGIVESQAGETQSGMSYIDTSGNLHQISVTEIDAALGAFNITSSIGTSLTIATAGSAWSYIDFNNEIQNIVIVSDIGIRNYVATQSSISFGSITDPFNSPITQDFVAIDGRGNFESFNPNSGFSIGNVSDNTDFIGGLTTSYAGVWDNGSPFQGIGLISVPDFGITFSSMVVNYGGGDEQQVRVIPGFGIQIISDMGGTESNIYVNEAKVDLSYDGSGARIVLDSSGLRLNTTQELYMNGLTAWSGTYSTADGRVATITKGIITNVS
jgi:hypothetical protein